MKRPLEPAVPPPSVSYGLSVLFGTFIIIALVAPNCAGCAEPVERSGESDPLQAQSGSGGEAGNAQTGGPAAGSGAAGASGQTAGDAGLAAGAGPGGHDAASGGVSGKAGQGGAAGRSDAGGGAGTGGTIVAGDGGGGAGTDGPASLNPFGCDFAWGTNDPGGSLDSLDYLHFVTKWVGYEVDAAGTISSCDGCWWLANQVLGTELVPVFYAYFIGFFGKANGLPDGNENPDGPNLTTHAAALIKSHRPQIIQMYTQYAQQSYAAWPERPLVWLLEGDFIQYGEDIQTDPLSLAELGLLAADITRAIKDAMPNAVVAVNHTSWNSDQETDAFWQGMQDARAAYDMVWTTGVANNDGYIEAGGTPTSYNAATATYAYLHALTGRKILVDTSFGLSAMADTWASADAATLNARIAEGVIAANVVTVPADYATRVATLAPLLSSTCD